MFKAGDKVYWNDPAINDFNEADRANLIGKVWEVAEVYGYDDEEKYFLLKDSFGSFTEAFAKEMKKVPDSQLTDAVGNDKLQPSSNH